MPDCYMFSALLYQSFCTLLLLHNKLITCILVYLGLLHIVNYTCIKPAQHNIIHLSHFTTSVCYTEVFTHVCISITIFKHPYYLHRYRYLYLLHRYITILHLLVCHHIVYNYLVMFLITMLES